MYHPDHFTIPFSSLIQWSVSYYCSHSKKKNMVKKGGIFLTKKPFCTMKNLCPANSIMTNENYITSNCHSEMTSTRSARMLQPREGGRVAVVGCEIQNTILKFSGAML